MSPLEPHLLHVRVKPMLRQLVLPASALFFLLASASPARAYIDPNIGGQLAQILAPIVTMIIGVLAFARQWLKSAFSRMTSAIRAFFRRVFG